MGAEEAVAVSKRGNALGQGSGDGDIILDRQTEGWDRTGCGIESKRKSGGR